jgi:hypothetical protein
MAWYTNKDMDSINKLIPIKADIDMAIISWLF